MDDENEGLTQEEKHAMLIQHGELMMRLMESERFVTFIQLNYDIKQRINHEEKTIEQVVIERPQELVQQIIAEQMKEKMEDSAGGIVQASADTLKKLEE